MIANLITVSRILLSIFLLFLSPYSVPFCVIYLLCGVTDVLDGFLARKLHTESKVGERLDSIADIIFAVVYAVKILPILHLPLWIWCWTVLIAVVKIVGIIIAGKKERSFYIAHSAANKLTGLLIFILPLTIRLFDVRYGAAVVCIVATFAAIYIRADERNIGSNAVIRKNGFEFIKKETGPCSPCKPELVTLNYYVRKG